MRVTTIRHGMTYPTSVRLVVVAVILASSVLIGAPAHAAVASEVVDDALQIYGDAAPDVIDVTCVGGDVR